MYKIVLICLLLLTGCVAQNFTDLDHSGNEGMIAFPMAGITDPVPPPPDSAGSVGAVGAVGAVKAEPEVKDCLYFTAKWCRPCRGFKQNVIPQLEKWNWLYAKKGKNHNIQPVDFDEENELAQEYKIDTLPTFVLRINGKEVRRVVGSMSAQDFVTFYNKREK